ncbi:pyridoxamine 5'-phosphate oxidase family protein [Streptomyces sp. SL13]|uniref:Pyridoxamine 5'-phosphate oxidase family protein n=1 Tax=Streptantibioticus silvisoli TaxID=2705255 RepID=A0AA90HF46_9ACTN|nr:pyridoxamine 5'-phosphate oxidase family protein [Streptantibioticus silvisoli]MDI5966545.1 pyridoxamine 5'-phosphate oxidase family protein [Streptantibioticus silvisoli]MDI5973807.1 pyridoxamine 5'-phosphate oxidase family protein [Streptantibioticus silvisoli]
MGKFYDVLTPALREFIARAPLFFTATAPLAADGRVNVSPKGGMDTFAVLDDRTVAYLDLIGSGAETIAHLRENGRITLMFCSFERQPKTLRLHGRGRCVFPGSPEWDALIGRFGDHPIPRSVVVVDVTRITDSCGFTVPEMTLVKERDLQDQWGARKSPQELEDYMRLKNTRSIDGLPARPHRPVTSPAPLS